MPTIRTEQELRAALDRVLPGVRDDLERLVRVPGIAFAGFDHSQVDRSAALVAELLDDCGLRTRVVRAGGQPAVIGHRPGPPGSPTVLLYAHHDVQPAGDPALWHSHPFWPVERDGRLYGRGAADDKAGVMAHVAALRAWGDDLPVGVTVFVEGEEEYGSASLERLLDEHAEALRADVIVVADSDNWDIGRPAFTTSLRGQLGCLVEVRGPDALTALVRLLSTLHDEAGEVAVAGLVSRETATVDYPEERLRREAGVLDGVRLVSRGRIADRLWAKPSLTVLGVDASHPRLRQATAKVSLRLAPGDDPLSGYEAVRTHLRAHLPRNVSLEVTLESRGDPCVVPADGPVYDAARAAWTTAWDGTAPVDIGIGGSIPCVAAFQRRFPEAVLLVPGIEDPYCAAHGPDESLHLADFARTCLAEALLLGELQSLTTRKVFSSGSAASGSVIPAASPARR
ncbi:acetylornithine deacetylase/succinyl-diaminopimelate desuccinylase-like protein [Actinoplanes octamycinicus]|uniref:Acetylornithine deacetylase/succinyl-diaminopimelate desuccinylase-like protein n=1 Tax=Actinoplanes octamycinicus TaxID=135948 RepID=A0A7W7H443_9ACTN|nr:acetylornithine deacetylase/succinyl-diaminopimelate desuccinylase-like protein [Actinoplanes octamycinicus]GIE61833.1 dipeptidase [Actinoplanes octamycinicus]